ncbi:Uncharacterized conserved protein, DUF1778 family [Cyclonatronum proteinivorum]|uniref:Uncharacterized conserved protein, DUF1778 family n=1 Tax=Cyclonatronum proteinivorum TaxID=1457365 RepID=A0A345UNP2_9BACT|nr:DUF1778 domain-containing protein [Cyclonatronum proteinivorum]AXJ02094.1 Uncharacterized conserved protein, DUF1778 family [Cyclonatronum proteinivorum]
MESLSTERINARVPRQQKQFFEQAAQLGGFRSLTDFILHAAQQKADLIVSEHQTILASKRDQEIFFEAITSPAEPNKHLKEAADRYKKLIDNL